MMHTYDSVVPAFPFHFLWCNFGLQSSLTARDFVPEVVDSASNPKNEGENVDSKTHIRSMYGPTLASFWTYETYKYK